MSFFKELKQSIESKIVGSLVRKKLDNFDVKSVNKITNEVADIYKDSVNMLGLLITTFVQDNKEEIVTLAENNSDNLIKVNKIVTDIKLLLLSLNTDTNKKSVQTIVNNYNNSSTIISKTANLSNRAENYFNKVVKMFVGTTVKKETPKKVSTKVKKETPKHHSVSDDTMSFYQNLGFSKGAIINMQNLGFSKDAIVNMTINNNKNEI